MDLTIFNSEEIAVLNDIRKMKGVYASKTFTYESLAEMEESFDFRKPLETLIQKGYLKIQENNYFLTAKCAIFLFIENFVPANADDFSFKVTQLARFQFMETLYLVSGKRPHGIINLWELSGKFSFNADLTLFTYNYLKSADLIKIYLFEGAINISAKGLLLMQSAISNPEKDFFHFLPLKTIFNIVNLKEREEDMAGPNPWVRENYSAFKKIKEGNRESIITWIKDIYGLKPFLNLEPEKKIILQTELNHFINLIQLDNPKKQYLKDIVYAINMILREMEDNFLVRKYIDKIPVINKLINGL